MDTQAQLQHPWTNDGFVGTPDLMDNNENNDYFSFNPSTTNYNINTQGQTEFTPHHSLTHPGYPIIFPQSQSPFVHPQSTNTYNNGFQIYHNNSEREITSINSNGQLRSSTSNMSLRSHRSTSSASSQISGYTWSTAQSEFEKDLDDNTSLSTSINISPSLISINQNEKHNKVPSLSIDPKLFRNSNQTKKEDETEMLETAKPKTPKSKKEELLGESPYKKQIKTRKERTKKCNTGNNGNIGIGRDESGGGKKVSHARKQTADHIPRPRNAFILFRKHVVDSKLIPASVEMRHQNVSIITAKMWSEAPKDQKAHFNELAKIEKEEHMKKYPGYRYQPVYRRTNVIRRRVRKDEAEEQKCKSVAELLIKGKSGEDLENEIKDKIRKGEKEIIIPEILEKKEEKPNSRRSSAACELSKGALRALRAQARQQSGSNESGNWSDISSSIRDRSESIGPRKLNSRRQSYAFEFEEEADFDLKDRTPDEIDQESNDNLFNNNNEQTMLGYGLAPSQIQSFAQQQQQIGNDSWSEIQQFDQINFDKNEEIQFHHFTSNKSIYDIEFQQQQQQQQQQQEQQRQQHQQQHCQGEFKYPSNISVPDQFSIHQPQTSFSSNSDPSTSINSSFLYPQPIENRQSDLHIQLPNTSINNNDFYTYDTALPFSPSMENFAFQHQQFDRGNDQTQMSITNDQISDSINEGENNHSNGIYEFKLPNNSNTNHIFNTNAEDLGIHPDQNQFFNVNFESNKWNNDHDHNNNFSSLLPPSSGVPLENLPFDDHLILNDFEAALAHADESGNSNPAEGW
ncbi:uncharacterized protein I206_105296 [Kwoniella pini CBS 10737]|uniref:HMG box domain-containing protein n=1 Tax=Kwoniella pini CBS 10737 TaxID=1296096 RepID=A0A1B9I4Q6_9TREE|nr:uncharacterized protein I206_03795 [Kwoniella pini CBS 10737]OCF50471.1 hypothetical protein I206_03795 [Kwoniella pini CBS 10737]